MVPGESLKPGIFLLLKMKAEKKKSFPKPVRKHCCAIKMKEESLPNKRDHNPKNLKFHLETFFPTPFHRPVFGNQGD